MEIVVAKSAGFCFGVKRATQMAFEASAETGPICSLGPIIHSPQVVQKLADRGVKVVERVEDVPPGSVIIRSHGVTSGELQALHDRNLSVIDATCPFVKKAQEYAARLAAENDARLFGCIAVAVYEKPRALLFAPPAFRVTVAAFNTRALRVLGSLGFERVDGFAAARDGRPFEVLVRREPAG